MDADSSAPGDPYPFAPNKGAAIFFTTAFACSGLFHAFQFYHYKCLKLTILLPICCAIEVAGLATRTYGAIHPDDAQTYTASTLLINLAPPAFQLANFLILGRLFHFIPYFAPMHPNRMFVTFASMTFIIELLTATGVAFLSNPSLPLKDLQRGDSMAKAALVLQILVFCLFSLLAGILHRCCYTGSIDSPLVRRPLGALYASFALILARTIYRLVEQFNTPLGPRPADPAVLHPAVRYEWYFYVFDASLMLLNSVLWNVLHPRRYLPENPVWYLAQDGKTQVKGPGWKDTRSLTETFMDPFAALTARGGHTRPFWEHNGYKLKRRR
ncbi:RTA1 domain protein [Immersiella caudata]|uniref:RTA1 domain protein n=1 Tax=Immersiella caudata TaxID=314043 RepID=A0AA40BUZ6_9PEZI|nr:RTA1 domain protein [Immersiella caudata]